MAGDLHYLLPEDVQHAVENALKNHLENGYSIFYCNNCIEFKYQFEFDPDIEDDVEFEGPVWTTHEGKTSEVILESTQTGDRVAEVKVKGEGNDRVLESSKSKYHDSE